MNKELLKYFDPLPAPERAQIMNLWIKPGIIVQEEEIPFKRGLNEYIYLLDLSKYDDIRYTFVIIFDSKTEIYFKRFTNYLEALKGYQHIKNSL